MKLVHYSTTPVSIVKSCCQEPFARAKPNGLWVSVVGKRDWLEWCIAEEWGNYQYTNTITLIPKAKILRITSLPKFDRFNDKYVSDIFVHWELVAKKYQGIIIAPYQWERRFRTSWYYGWDVASGCIWDASAVKNVYTEPFKMIEKEWNNQEKER